MDDSDGSGEMDGSDRPRKMFDYDGSDESLERLRELVVGPDTGLPRRELSEPVYCEGCAVRVLCRRCDTSLMRVRIAMQETKDAGPQGEEFASVHLCLLGHIVEAFWVRDPSEDLLSKLLEDDPS